VIDDDWKGPTSDGLNRCAHAAVEMVHIISRHLCEGFTVEDGQVYLYVVGALYDPATDVVTVRCETEEGVPYDFQYADLIVHSEKITDDDYGMHPWLYKKLVN